MAAARNMVFVYLGRRGAIARMTVELARSLPTDGSINASFVIAHANELADQLRALPIQLKVLRLFDAGLGAALEVWRAPKARQVFREALAAAEPDAVIELMPHVWSRCFADLPHSVGALRAAIVHDWRAHPGDLPDLTNRWLNSSAVGADRVLTMSRFVASEISNAHPKLSPKVRSLFHPDFCSVAPPLAVTAAPLRVLFLGRLLAYKGLDILIEATEMLRARGVAIELKVAGAGDITSLKPRISALGAHIVNRWVSDQEVDAALSWCDVVAASYREASQSGIVAAAFGAGRPVVATPVGALPEQVAHEHTGLIAARADGASMAEQLARLAIDPGLGLRLAQNILSEAPQRSMAAFARAIAVACGRNEAAHSA